MHLRALVNRLDELESSNKNQSIFENIGKGDSYFTVWEKEIHPVLCEVALNPNQIQQLFKDLEKGGGRTGLGKAADAIKGTTDKISDVWFNKFGGMLQSSAPVQAFDQKWEDIKSKVAAKHPELAAKLAKYGEFAKNNPNLHKFLLAIAGSAAAALGVAAAGGIAAGALSVGTGTGVAVGILNIADRLLQGQKVSTAIGRGATTGAIAGFAAGAAAKIGEMIRAGISSDVIANLKGMRISRHIMEYNGQMFSAVTKEPETSMLKNAWDAMTKDFTPTSETIQKFAEILDKVNDPVYQEQIAKTREIAVAAKEAAKSSIAVVRDLTNIAASAAGGAASAATNQQPKEDLSEHQIQELFGFTGNKVDAGKLEKAWKKAGSPTDSEDIKQLLQQQGLDAAAVDTAIASVTGGTTASTPPAQTGSQQSNTAQTSTPQQSQSQSGVSTAAGAMKADDIVKSLDDVWKKVTADQGSETSSGQVQQQIRTMAKQAAMGGQTFESKYQTTESVKFYSKFLGKDI